MLEYIGGSVEGERQNKIIMAASNKQIFDLLQVGIKI